MWDILGMLFVIGMVVALVGFNLHDLCNSTPYVLSFKHSNVTLCRMGVHSYVESDSWYDSKTRNLLGKIPLIRTKKCTNCEKIRYGKFFYGGEQSPRWEWRDQPHWFYWDI